MAEENEFFIDDCGYFPNLKKKEELGLIPSEKSCKKMYSNENIILPEGYSFQECVYDSLLSWGWRRSGKIFYRETCPHCKKCLPIRVDVNIFSPSKSQRKSLRKNQDVEISLCNLPKDLVTDEKVQLFKNYDRRHNPTEKNSDEKIREELMWLNGIDENGDKYYSGTFNMDYRVNGQLIGVGVVDRGLSSLSSNYFYYDISEEVLKRSLGVFSVIQEIEACRGNLFGGKLKSEEYYLGYYIAECEKMKYKIQYRPNQLLVEDEWIDSGYLQKEGNA